MLEETFGDVKTSAPNAALEFYDASDLDLTIQLERNNWVRQRARPKLAVALTGDFRLQKAPHGIHCCSAASSLCRIAATSSSSPAASTSKAARCSSMEP
jgi:hypothetical protein